MLKKAIFAIALVLGSACASTATTVLTFDDAVPDEMGVIRNYAGFSWYGFYFQDGGVHVGTGFPDGRPDYGTGTTIPSILGGFEAATPFSLKRLYLSSVDNDDNVVTFQGFKGTGFGTLAFEQTVTVNTGALTPIDFNWGDLTGVGIISNKGFVVVDNVAVSPVPEPSSMALTLSGVGLVGFLVRRKKNARA